jgi:hypothetical protein
MKKFIILVTLVICLTSHAQTNHIWGDLKSGPYTPGFQLIPSVDRSRFYPQMNNGTMPGRNIRIYIWYPANDSPDNHVRFEDYVRMAAEDFDLKTNKAENQWSSVPIPVQLDKGLSREQLKFLWSKETLAIMNADPSKGTFPLIVLGQGLYYESPLSHIVLCEFLASHGYVVITSPLLGTRNRLVNLTVEDLETQIRDLEFVIGFARALPYVNPDKLGIIGYDLGGMAGLLLSMRNPDIDAFLSLDSGILLKHFSGLPHSHPHYREERFTIPWMHITQKRFAENLRNNQRTTSLFDRKYFGESFLISVDTDNHGLFTSYAMFAMQNPVAGYWGPIQNNLSSLYQEIYRYSLTFFDGYLKQDAKAVSKLTKITTDSLITIKYQAGHTAPPSKDEIIHLIIQNGFSEAEPVIEQVRKSYSDSLLFDENGINWLGYHFLYWWGRQDEAIKVFHLNTLLFPKSPNTFDSLGEAYLITGNREKAKESYQRSLELNPENQNAKAVLEQMKH